MRIIEIYKLLLARIGGASTLVKRVDRDKYTSQFSLGIMVILLSLSYCFIFFLDLGSVLEGKSIVHIVLPITYYILFIFLNSYLLSITPNLSFTNKKFPSGNDLMLFFFRVLIAGFNIFLLYSISLKGLRFDYLIIYISGFLFLELIPYIHKLFRSATPYDYLHQIEKKKQTENYRAKLKKYEEELNKVNSGKIYRDTREKLVDQDFKEHHIYISSIQIRNIRCFVDTILNFESDKSKSGMLTTIIGDNASGKSTLLKAICLGITDESGSIGLLKAEKGKFIRKGEKKGEIVIIIKDYINSDECTITTEFFQDELTGEEVIRKHYSGNKSIYKNVFLCAYGSHRNNSSDQSINYYSKYESVKHLFDKNEKLLNPELILLRQTFNDQQRIINSLKAISNSKDIESNFEILNEGIHINGHPISSSSDGFVATLNWVLDLYGRAIAYGYLKNSPKLIGVIVIDEIETHLHPKWQIIILDRLRKSFPFIQFICTTHTPLILSASSDYSDSSVYRLDCVDGITNRVKLVSERFKNRTFQEIILDGFDLTTTKSPIELIKSNRYDELLNTAKKTKEEQNEFEELRRKIYRDDKEFALNSDQLDQKLKKFKR